ncbi:MAG: quinol:electron acceptor oxidoreductase subunit ActD [Chloroflexota bacterium]|jgi:hypothetical protein|nr:hypothetical protein [Chloroflexota bacterium]MQF65890.1 DUF3341 domain-containing protein [SAR202 cluster bacterium AC-647-P02_OGT_505m]MQG01015.1 DUF3341 domain-containing protein [SAR202 cluster bacterium]PKB60648.1 MAG: hypothetical protein BZY64_00480 [SAR202 cluster bacterium Ae2-Chloro-G1]MBE42653.1 hypothetical protein [Chloroflexota bacterium]|tara:strand:- start:22410 stop:22925 length:516 start_codon:yes stop_codon:yes gene_type:complete
MAKKSVLGLYTEEDSAADALDNLRDAGFEEGEYELLTGTPYPEGTFGEAEPEHHLFRWPLIGAACGFTGGLIITAGTQMAYPLITGGKPILSIPPMAIIMYEGTMLGAIIFTIIGIIFESRLPRLFMGAYSEKITEGHIGVTVTTEEGRTGVAEEALKKAGAEGDIIRGWE